MSRLKKIRKEKGLTQYQLSDITGIGRVNITRYETGTSNVPLKNAQKLADALGCTLDELFGTYEPGKGESYEKRVGITG